MTTSWGVFLTVALGVLAARPAAADPATEERTNDCVARYPGSPPASDLPTPAQRKALKGCDAEALYYGIGQPADPVRARLCAFTEPDSFAQKGPFSGNSLLMMIYANGVGASQNLPYAKQLACKSVAGQRLFDLLSHGLRRNYSWCDEVPDNLSEHYCAGHDDRIEAWRWQQQLNALAVTLPWRVRASFAALRVAQSAWAKARSHNEIDQTGSISPEDVMLESRFQGDDFLQMVRRLQAARPPRLGIAQLTAANVRMQHSLEGLMSLPAAYARAQHSLQMLLPTQPNLDVNELFGTTITPEGIQATQQVWLRYREAWGFFAAVAYPHWGRDGAEAWVTMKRADMLEHLLAHLEPPLWQQDPVLLRQHWLLVRQHRATASSPPP